jgi:hypothetical protein
MASLPKYLYFLPLGKTINPSTNKFGTRGKPQNGLKTKMYEISIVYIINAHKRLQASYLVIVDLINPNNNKTNLITTNVKIVVRTKSKMRWSYTLEEMYHEASQRKSITLKEY